MATTLVIDAGRLRQRLADAAQRIIDALDALDEPDDDIEPDADFEEGADAEPSLGSTHGKNQTKSWGALQRAASVHGEDSNLKATRSQNAISRTGTTLKLIRPSPASATWTGSPSRSSASHRLAPRTTSTSASRGEPIA
jgi:hypothetical protein